MVRGNEKALIYVEAGQFDYGLWAAGPYLERQGEVQLHTEDLATGASPSTRAP